MELPEIGELNLENQVNNQILCVGGMNYPTGNQWSVHLRNVPCNLTFLCFLKHEINKMIIQVRFTN